MRTWNELANTPFREVKHDVCDFQKLSPLQIYTPRNLGVPLTINIGCVYNQKVKLTEHITDTLQPKLSHNRSPSLMGSCPVIYMLKHLRPRLGSRSIFPPVTISRSSFLVHSETDVKNTDQKRARAGKWNNQPSGITGHGRKISRGVEIRPFCPQIRQSNRDLKGVDIFTVSPWKPQQSPCSVHEQLPGFPHRGKVAYDHGKW